MTIIEMRENRANLVNQARELVTNAEKEKRDFNQEDQQQYDRIMKEVDELKNKIDREEKLSALENDLNEPVNQPHKTQPKDQNKNQKQGRASDEYKNAFWQVFRNGKESLNHEQVNLLMDPQIRNLAVGTDANGGYLVPDEFERQIIKGLEEQNIMRQLATVITTSSGAREIPVETDYGTANWMGEKEQYTESEATFDQETLNAYKAGTIIKVSEELLNDSAFSIDNYVAGAFAKRFGNLEEAAFVNGDGSNKPTGVVQSAQVGHTTVAGQVDGLIADDFIELFHSLKRPYRRNASFLANDGTVKAVRKIKDNDGQYIWQPGLQAGEPDRILARPVYVADDMPALGAGNKPIAFGDYSYYWIADRQGRVMQRLNELYAATGQVGFRMFERLDGKLILPEAVRVLQSASE
ncbi:phage major capsid protein [Lentibacillus salicampi]|uniref:Phage major capsid protein n=1 Tax=Lentibacillus salicampi TaxID=175306 RepID=A0A4Y9A9Z5_9BACI|nr:phage major capsid protein [Lentibacillus salicampi]TFJ92142.1 phage major capsid protein [Lentibacillus salicampi]